MVNGITNWKKESTEQEGVVRVTLKEGGVALYSSRFTLTRHEAITTNSSLIGPSVVTREITAIYEVGKLVHRYSTSNIGNALS